MRDSGFRGCRASRVSPRILGFGVDSGFRGFRRGWVSPQTVPGLAAIPGFASPPQKQASLLRHPQKQLTCWKKWIPYQITAMARTGFEDCQGDLRQDGPIWHMASQRWLRWPSMASKTAESHQPFKATGGLDRLLFQPPSSPSGRGLPLPHTPSPWAWRGRFAGRWSA